MDYKKKYEVQLKVNKSLQNELDRFREALYELTEERDGLLFDNQQMKIQLEVTEPYQAELKEEIAKAREMQKKYESAIAEAKTIKEKYEVEFNSFLIGARLDSKR